MKKMPKVLTIAGSDPSGGAGIQADIKVFQSLGVYGLSAITCITSQAPGFVHSISPVSGEHIANQIKTLSDHYSIAAIKLGLLNTTESINAILCSLNKFKNSPPLIIDPIIESSKGTILLESKALELYKRELLPIASLYTPNLNEAEILLGLKNSDQEEMGKNLFNSFKSPVLLKGGHLNNDKARDIFVDQNGITAFDSDRIKDIDPHGTGCFYSASICALVALGYPIKEAISKSKKIIFEAISKSENLGGITNTLNYDFKEFLA